MPTPQELAKVVGRIMADPVYRAAFQSDPNSTLAHENIKLSQAHIDKLKDLSTKLNSPAVAAGGPAPTHINCASSVGVA